MPETPPSSAAERLDLLDWKRRVFALYDEVRRSGQGQEGWQRWREERDRLFAEHSSSAIPASERAGFRGLPYFPYDPSARVLAGVKEAPSRRYDITTSGDGSYAFTRFATASFNMDGEELSVELYWLEGYGGGLFLPFGDSTSGDTTYGGGRYLLDTVKGSDLGAEDGRLVLDFNFAYNPSCAYDPRWVCPLTPAANRLRIAVLAGERLR